ncbi:MAG TPA: hypothetical protein VLA56_20130 [Pseudomonadales bacterium]|nr:hypothetical protein [Pseudomonadales bacterium]
MSASEGKGGASPLIWAGLGVVVGIAGGWWYDAYVPYTLFGTLLGWFTGLLLADSGTGAEH